MGLIDQVINDIADITSNKDGFAVDLTFTRPDKSVTVIIPGQHCKHNLNVDTEGNVVSSKKAFMSFSEKVLVATGYVVRNSKQEVDLVNHLLSVKDSSGILKNYIISQIFPDETIGLITCILEDYED